MRKTVSLTKEGKAALEQELAELTAQRPQIAERLATARAFGDLSENQEYTDARAEQKMVENRIIEIEETLKNAKLIRSGSKNTVGIGVKVKFKIGNKTSEYSIVGPIEADPASGRISDQSPIGKAMLGKKVDEEFTLPNGKKGKILEIA